MTILGLKKIGLIAISDIAIIPFTVQANHFILKHDVTISGTKHMGIAMVLAQSANNEANNMPYGGKVLKLKIKRVVAGGGTDRIYVRKNGVATAIDLTFVPADVGTYKESTDEVTFDAGDLIGVTVVKVSGVSVAFQYSICLAMGFNIGSSTP